MSSYWLFYSTIGCLFICLLTILTYLRVWIVFVFTWWTLNPSSVFTAIKSFFLLVCFIVISIGRTQHLIWTKVFIVQNNTCFSRKVDIMVRACEMSLETEQPKEVEGSIYPLFTTFIVFTNSAPALLVLMVKQNNAVEVYFSLSYKTLKQTKDKKQKK